MFDKKQPLSSWGGGTANTRQISVKNNLFAVPIILSVILIASTGFAFAQQPPQISADGILTADYFVETSDGNADAFFPGGTQFTPVPSNIVVESTETDSVFVGDRSVAFTADNSFEVAIYGAGTDTPPNYYATDSTDLVDIPKCTADSFDRGNLIDGLVSCYNFYPHNDGTIVISTIQSGNYALMSDGTSETPTTSPNPGPTNPGTPPSTPPAPPSTPPSTPPAPPTNPGTPPTNPSTPPVQLPLQFSADGILANTYFDYLRHSSVYFHVGTQFTPAPSNVIVQLTDTDFAYSAFVGDRSAAFTTDDFFNFRIFSTGTDATPYYYATDPTNLVEIPECTSNSFDGDRLADGLMACHVFNTTQGGTIEIRTIQSGNYVLMSENDTPLLDTTPPQFTGTPENITVIITEIVRFDLPAATDDSGTVTVVCNPASGSSFQIGTTTVTCTATDPSGNSTTTSFSVIVEAIPDTTIPQFTDFPSTTVFRTSGQTLVVQYDLPVATDNSGTVNVVCDPAPGSTFRLGVTAITCTATDPSGNSATTSFNIVVRDPAPGTIPPRFTATPEDITVGTLGPSRIVQYDLPTAIDGSVPIDVTCDPAPGSTFQVGTTIVTCTANATSGHSVSISFSVIVLVDITPPEFTGTPPNVTRTNVQGPATVDFILPPATDNSGTATVTCDHESGDTFQIGTTRVTCTATDISGNIDIVSFDVIVIGETTPPRFTSTPEDVRVGSTTTSAIVTFDLPTATDNSGNVDVTCDPASGSSFPLSSTFPFIGTTVTCTATDPAGNTATISFQVFVLEDAEPPVFLDDPGVDITVVTTTNAPIIVNYDRPSANDNSRSYTISCDPNTGDTFPVGPTMVTCTATDASGNSAEVTFVVTVLVDTTSPQFTGTPENITETALAPVIVTFDLPTATDDSGTPTVTCDPAPGSTFQVGTTEVICTATDPAGNTTTISFTVTLSPPSTPITPPTPPTIQSITLTGTGGTSETHILQVSDIPSGYSFVSASPASNLSDDNVTASGTDSGGTVTISFGLPSVSTTTTITGDLSVRYSDGTTPLDVTVPVTLTVNPPDPPTVTDITATGTENTTITETITVTNVPAGYTFTSVSADSALTAAGVSISGTESGGTISVSIGLPSTQATPITGNIVVTYGDGTNTLTSDSAVSLTVNPASTSTPTPPTIQSIRPNLSPGEGVRITLEVSNVPSGYSFASAAPASNLGDDVMAFGYIRSNGDPAVVFNLAPDNTDTSITGDLIVTYSNDTSDLEVTVPIEITVDSSDSSIQYPHFQITGASNSTVDYTLQTGNAPDGFALDSVGPRNSEFSAAGGSYAIISGTDLGIRFTLPTVTTATVYGGQLSVTYTISGSSSTDVIDFVAFVNP